MLNDLRYAFRTLARTPGFTAMAVLTMALGIGVNTALFTIVHAVLLKPLPYRDPERLVRFLEGRPDVRVNISYPNFLDWRTRSRSFEDLAIFNPASRTIVSGDGTSEVVRSATTEARLFTMLGVDPIVGRSFTPEEEASAQPSAVIISYRLWQRRFAQSPSVLEQSIGGLPIVGVLPPECRVESVDVWFPLAPTIGPMQRDRGNHPGFFAYGKLKAGVALSDAQREMSSIAADLERQYPATNHRMGVIVRPLLDSVVGTARPMLQLLTASVTFLLLIGCANLANALLARGLRRQRETAVRAALGAGRVRLARLFLAEGLAMSACGCGIAVLLAAWLVRAARALPAFVLPRGETVAIDPQVLAYAIGLSIVTGLLCGLAPAWQLSRVDLLSSLRLTGSVGGSVRAQLRGGLIALEVALSLMLSVGAGLMIRTLGELAAVNPGYRADGLLSVNLQQSRDVYSTPERSLAFTEQLLARLQGSPGVASVAAAWPLDLVNFGWTPYVRVHDKPVPAGQEPPVRTASVTPSFFSTLAIPIVGGRIFDDHDRSGSPIVIVVNQTFVQRLLPPGDPIGRRISPVGIPQLAGAEIVGVVGDTLRAGLAGDAGPEMYCAYAQFPEAGATIVVRAARGDPLQLTRLVEARVADIDRDVATYRPVRIADALADTVGDRRLLSMLLSSFAALALVLTVVGIAAVTSCIVAQRTWEIGVRMALGANATSIVRTVVTSVLAPVLAGSAVGTLATVPLTRVIARYLFHVAPVDPIAIGGAAFVLVATAFAAAYVPARRATRIDPLMALRE
jgi:putative ABC transport system permease protein